MNEPGEIHYGTRVENAVLAKAWDVATASALCQQLQLLINLAA